MGELGDIIPGKKDRPKNDLEKAAEALGKLGPVPLEYKPNTSQNQETSVPSLPDFVIRSDNEEKTALRLRVVHDMAKQSLKAGVFRNIDLNENLVLSQRELDLVSTVKAPNAIPPAVAEYLNKNFDSVRETRPYFVDSPGIRPRSNPITGQQDGISRRDLGYLQAATGNEDDMRRFAGDRAFETRLFGASAVFGGAIGTVSLIGGACSGKLSTALKIAVPGLALGGGIGLVGWMAARNFEIDKLQNMRNRVMNDVTSDDILGKYTK